MDQRPDGLGDRQAIQDTCVSYAMALDQQDWAWLGELFTPDAVAVYGGGLGVREGYEAIETACRAALTPLTGSQHLMGNHLVRQRGEEADAVCYFQATHHKVGTPGGDLYTVAGRYDDRLVLTGGAWRIARKVLTVQWTAGNPDILIGASRPDS